MADADPLAQFSDAATPPVVVTVAGPSDSGKTTLVVDLLAAIADDYRVGTVKSIHHDIEPDTPGKDTHRHRTAGAETAVGITPSYTFEVTPGGKADGEAQALAATLSRLAGRGFDLVLVEGFSEAPLPTIRVGDPAARDHAGTVIGTDDDSVAELVDRLEARIKTAGDN